MEKIVLRRKLVLENGILIPKFYYPKKAFNAKENEKLKTVFDIGWNIEPEGVDCNPKCPLATVDGYWQCISGQCVFFPY